MSEDVRDEVPHGEEVGDISSGHGNPDAAPHVSDEKAAAMLAADGTDTASEDGYVDQRKLVERPADAPPLEDGRGGGGAGSW